jgi:hypothetical protein
MTPQDKFKDVLIYNFMDLDDTLVQAQWCDWAICKFIDLNDTIWQVKDH